MNLFEAKIFLLSLEDGTNQILDKNFNLNISNKQKILELFKVLPMNGSQISLIKFLLHYKKRENQIIEYKGEPYLIGGVDSRVIKTFKTQEIPYKTGDYIYMFTDGYVDQFGGPNNKKLMKEQFMEWLLSFKHLGLNYQGQLLEQKLLKWRGGIEQTDDILVVGIKL